LQVKSKHCTVSKRPPPHLFPCRLHMPKGLPWLLWECRHLITTGNVQWNWKILSKSIATTNLFDCHSVKNPLLLYVCKLFHDVLIRSCVFFSCLFAHCPYLLWCVCAYPCASPGGCVVHPMTIGAITHSHVYSSRWSMSIFP
jgi:hypothetical protein